MFKITAGRGFQITFANGWTVSVQWGTGNYCENRTVAITRFTDWETVDREVGAEGCPDAEIAAWKSDGKWFDFGSDEVAGHQTPASVAAFIAQIAARP